MTPQELLKKKSASINVIYHKFVLISSKLGQSVLYCFFEGNEDGSYYISRINKFFNSTEPIVCKGKDNVIGIFYKLNQKNKSDAYKKAFFVDRDFDDPQNVEGLYETPAYSIENLYCSENCFKKILQNEFHLNSTDSEFEQCIIFYGDRKKEFHNAVLLFNAWYYSKKRLGKCNVSLDKRFPDQFINWDFANGITACY